MVFNATFQHYFSYIVAVSFIGGGNRSTGRRSPIWRKPRTIFITYCCIEYTSPELHVLVRSRLRIYTCKGKYRKYLTMCVHDKSYFRNGWCVLTQISTFITITASIPLLGELLVPEDNIHTVCLIYTFLSLKLPFLFNVIIFLLRLRFSSLMHR